MRRFPLQVRRSGRDNREGIAFSMTPMVSKNGLNMIIKVGMLINMLPESFMVFGEILM